MKRLSLLGLAAVLLVTMTGYLLFASAPSAPNDQADGTPDTLAIDPSVADTATFAGGCFWCMEPPFDRIDGVAATISGFSGGDVENPSYRQVTSGGTGHRESLQVIYDSTAVSYNELLYVFWRNVDPLDDGGQFCDRGYHYSPAIFPHDAGQRAAAETTRDALTDRFDQPIVVAIDDFDAFYAAEEYHQNYYEKNPDHYYRYRRSCGRDARLEALWGDEANPS
ncbi:MAG: peptide-methionine (S)-S-oxide reductase MsrA [Bacteroidetes bacterium]|jgi:peptide-methionine (S)-S-oxide reductase|nr:peptide-methionine (S)-S-oxide reductase MsrA [Bacteroidota bacterium]